MRRRRRLLLLLAIAALAACHGAPTAPTLEVSETTVTPFRIVGLRSTEDLRGAKVSATIDEAEVPLVVFGGAEVVFLMPDHPAGSATLTVTVDGARGAPIVLEVQDLSGVATDPAAEMQALSDSVSAQLDLLAGQPVSSVTRAAVTAAKQNLVTLRQTYASLGPEQRLSVARLIAANRAYFEAPAGGGSFDAETYRGSAEQFSILISKIAFAGALGALAVPLVGVAAPIAAGVAIAHYLPEAIHQAEIMVTERAIVTEALGIGAEAPSGVAHADGPQFVSDRPRMIGAHALFRTLTEADRSNTALAPVVRVAATGFDVLPDVVRAANELPSASPYPAPPEPVADSGVRTVDMRFLSVSEPSDTVRIVSQTPTPQGLQTTFTRGGRQCHSFTFRLAYDDGLAPPQETTISAAIDCETCPVTAQGAEIKFDSFTVEGDYVVYIDGVPDQICTQARRIDDCYAWATLSLSTSVLYDPYTGEAHPATEARASACIYGYDTTGPVVTATRRFSLDAAGAPQFDYKIVCNSADCAGTCTCSFRNGRVTSGQ